MKFNCLVGGCVCVFFGCVWLCVEWFWVNCLVGGCVGFLGCEWLCVEWFWVE